MCVYVVGSKITAVPNYFGRPVKLQVFKRWPVWLSKTLKGGPALTWSPLPNLEFYWPATFTTSS